MTPFFNQQEKTQWINHNCKRCDDLIICNIYNLVANLDNIKDSIANQYIGIGFDGFLEANCKGFKEKFILKNTK